MELELKPPTALLWKCHKELGDWWWPVQKSVSVWATGSSTNV